MNNLVNNFRGNNGAASSVDLKLNYQQLLSQIEEKKKLLMNIYQKVPLKNNPALINNNSPNNLVNTQSKNNNYNFLIKFL